MADVDSHTAIAAMIRATATTYTPRRTLPIIIMANRLITASSSAAQARCCSAGSAGWRGGRGPKPLPGPGRGAGGRREGGGGGVC